MLPEFRTASQLFRSSVRNVLGEAALGLLLQSHGLRSFESSLRESNMQTGFSLASESSVLV
ncbi:hypothetical protein QTJ16_001350 [Diplocarpon rosae]|uniref:Uncharacterized protein n=1 Tax=Diplocarpon rosae TaxID=946125 RepID=A0AAD9T8D3_9HELO|nr:hypothetical protein QTJ16_001350 [Diplocarpon rosae]